MKRQYSSSELPRHWNKAAVKLSAIPGLGQFYKGHIAEAFFMMTLCLGVLIWTGTLFCLFYAAAAILAALGISVDWISVLFNPITFYFGFIPALLFWVWVAIDAYDEPDLRHHLPSSVDEPTNVKRLEKSDGRG